MKKNFKLLSFIIFFFIVFIAFMPNVQASDENGGIAPNSNVLPPGPGEPPAQAPIPNGKYCIVNVELNNYLKITEEDCSNNYSTNLVPLELWPYSTGEHHLWEFTRVYGDVYKIISCKSQKAITVKKDYTNMGNIDLIQETYQDINRQHWKISEVSSGKYKLKPVSGIYQTTDWVMGASASGSIDGRRVQQIEYTNNSNYRDLWKFIPILPTSGSELEYNPEEWNATPIRNNTNCYCYAFNFQAFYTNDLGYQYYNKKIMGRINPGCLDNIQEILDINSPYVNGVTSQLVFENTIQDKLAKNFIFNSIGINQQCPDGQYKVALAIDVNNTDYHWYRQNLDGSWSHKRGAGFVTNKDASNKIIFNPSTSNNYYEYYDENYQLNYVNYIVVGYYSVTPLNIFYDSNTIILDLIMNGTYQVDATLDQLKSLKFYKKI
ncbi:MAG TPA: RICIN domain-containing protein [Acholeplasmataceae bacterium]|jgi:hypothetical protein|nr:RICIN domain-containing protein [Acholeplasmataceae bacterium]